MDVAGSIAADRIRLGMSQQELANRVGVSQQSVSKWEEGTATPRGKRLSKLIDTLGSTSQTAAQIRQTLPIPSNNDTQPMGQLSTPVSQAQALAALAQAAQDIAKAAQAIANSVAVMTQQGPPGKH